MLDIISYDLAKDVAIGLLGAAIAAAATRALTMYREHLLNKSYPIAGTYISYFEDEANGEKFVVTSETSVIQTGLTFKAINHVKGGKSWELEGRIVQNLYLTGVYLAESPYDPGNGTFFLRIEGRDFDGLWSGYDSVNGSIAGGRYWFKRIIQVKIVEFEDAYRAPALSIADAVLGAGFLNDLSDGDGFHDVKSLISLDDGRVVGFVSYAIEPEDYLSSSEKVGGIKFTPDTRSSAKRGLLGHIRIVGVDPSVQGRGIGSSLVEEAEKRLKNMGAETILVFGWTSPDGTHIGGILRRLGYTEFDQVDDFWKAESELEGYDCAVCGNPCRCAVIAFKKSV